MAGVRSNRWLLNDVCRLAVENLLYAARKRGLEPGIFCAIHTYGRRLNWHPHVHVSVTCGGLNKHGQWKKLSFLKDAMRSRWMWNMRQLLLKAWSEGMAMPESLSHITTESQWRSLVLKAGGKYWHVYMSKKTAGGRNTARYLGSLSEEATNSGFPTGALQRRNESELPLPGPQK